MSSYSDSHKAVQQREFIERWAPETDFKLTAENLRWNIARARAAEDELRLVKDALRTIKDAIR